MSEAKIDATGAAERMVSEEKPIEEWIDHCETTIQLVGALKIHEILIDQNLVVKKKNLPNDPFYKSVLIKESRRKSTISNDSDSGSEFDDIVDSDD